MEQMSLVRRHAHNCEQCHVFCCLVLLFCLVNLAHLVFRCVQDCDRRQLLVERHVEMWRFWFIQEICVVPIVLKQESTVMVVHNRIRARWQGVFI